MRVLVGDPHFSLEGVRDLLADAPVAVEAAEPPWAGDDVVALLVGPDYPVAAAYLERLPGLRNVATFSIG